MPFLIKSWTLHRDWRRYSKENILLELGSVEWASDINYVQNYWDDLKSKLIVVIDKLLPLVEFKNYCAKADIPPIIKNKIYKKTDYSN